MSSSSSYPSLLATALQRCASAAPKKATRAWADFAITISQLEDADVRNDPDRMIRVILEAGYEEYLQETYTNYRSRMEDLELTASEMFDRLVRRPVFAEPD